MINKINDINELMPYEKRDIFYYRIMSLIEAYGTKYDFALFYRQEIDCKITAIISKLDGDFTVSFDDNADVEELEEFCEIIGFNSLLTDNRYVSDRNYTEGAVMKTDKKIELRKASVTVDRYPKLIDLYNFLDYDNMDFEAWYVDISHRIRHNCALAYSLCTDGNIVSSAILSSVYDDGAVLTGVRTENEYRGNGFGSALVSEIICDFAGTVYLMREKDINEQFYKNLGFVNCGIWRMYK